MIRVWGGASGEAPSPGKKPHEKPTLPPQAMEHLRQGQNFLQEKKLPEALKEFQETARLAPESPQSHLWVGRVFLQQKDFPQAEQAFKKALELDPKNYQALAMLGKNYSFDKGAAKQRPQ
jgi:cytochrome c-type biogenesis protein CcmH/NrfG